MPGPHRTNVGTPLAPDVAEHVKEVYIRLAHVDLLKRCTLGKTQNANESLHSVVWSKCPKMIFVGLERVVSATCSAVSQFNAGIKVTMKNLCEVMQVPSGAHLLASAEKACSRRSVRHWPPQRRPGKPASLPAYGQQQQHQQTMLQGSFRTLMNNSMTFKQFS